VIHDKVVSRCLSLDSSGHSSQQRRACRRSAPLQPSPEVHRWRPPLSSPVRRPIHHADSEHHTKLQTIRLMIKDEPGVMKVRLGRKQSHTTYSVPDSVAKRIHNRLLCAV